MTLIVRLVPKLSDPNFEKLRGGITERPTLVFRSDCPEGELIVGRGTHSGIADERVKRKAFRLNFDDACFEENQVLASLYCAADEPSTIFFNSKPLKENQIHLSHGDVISLHELNYEYTVKIDFEEDKKRKAKEMSSADNCSETSNEQVAGERSTNDDPSTLSTGVFIPEASASKLADEINCSICLEIQVHPRTINPCGHSFCGNCIQPLQECPQCRNRVVSHVPAVQLESLISTLVSVPNIFDKEDVDHFHERQATQKKQVLSNPATKKRRQSSQARSYLRNPYASNAANHTPTQAHASPAGLTAASSRIRRRSPASSRRRERSARYRYFTGGGGENFAAALPPPPLQDDILHQAFQPPGNGNQAQNNTAGRSLEEAIVID